VLGRNFVPAAGKDLIGCPSQMAKRQRPSTAPQTCSAGTGSIQSAEVARTPYSAVVRTTGTVDAVVPVAQTHSAVVAVGKQSAEASSTLLAVVAAAVVVFLLVEPLRHQMDCARPVVGSSWRWD